MDFGLGDLRKFSPEELRKGLSTTFLGFSFLRFSSDSDSFEEWRDDDRAGLAEDLEGDLEDEEEDLRGELVGGVEDENAGGEEATPLTALD